MFQLQNLLRPHIDKIKPYSSARNEYSGTASIFLDANENPHDSVIEGKYNRYPDPCQFEIKKRLCTYLGHLNTEQIFLGNGSDEAIDLLLRVFCEPLIDNVVITPPTYGMYEVSAAINNIELKKISLAADFQLQVKEVLDATNQNTKIIFLCSPNNPSGNDLDRKDVIKILGNTPALVVVDEAYIDFSHRKSYIHDLDKYPNLVVIQTFSKAWGMAALRLGIAYASAEIVSILNKVKPPYNINSVTQEKVLKAFDCIAKKERMVHDILQERTKLTSILSNLVFVEKVFPSDANFLLIKMKNARKIYEYLVKQGIIVRDRSKVQLCENCLRITVGTKRENKMLIDTISKFVPLD